MLQRPCPFLIALSIQATLVSTVRASGKVMNQRDAPAASFCRKSTALCAACADDTGMAAAACSSGSIHNVISRSEEHTSELQSLMRISYAVFCLKKKTPKNIKQIHTP